MNKRQSLLVLVMLLLSLHYNVTAQPTNAPSNAPTSESDGSPTTAPTTADPTNAPTRAPTNTPTEAPPTSGPSSAPTNAPTNGPTTAPTAGPSSAPTFAPTNAPTAGPSDAPTNGPTTAPTNAPSGAPTTNPSNSPTAGPSRSPSTTPTRSPTHSPTSGPTRAPTNAPTLPFADGPFEVDSQYNLVHEHVNINIPGGQNFAGVLFRMSGLPADLRLASNPDLHVGNLSLSASAPGRRRHSRWGGDTPPPTPFHRRKRPLRSQQGGGGGGSIVFPDAMTLQMGGATMFCANDYRVDTVTSSRRRHAASNAVTDNERRHIDSDAVAKRDGGGDGAPAFLIPLPAIQNSLSVLFGLFSGLEPPTPQPELGALMWFKLTAVSDNGGAPNAMVPDNWDPSTCIISLVSDFYSGVTGVAAGPASHEWSPPCDPTSLGTTHAEMLSVINTGLNASVASAGAEQDKDVIRSSLESLTWSVASLEMRDSWRGCRALLDSFVVRGAANVTTPPSRDCRVRHDDPDWATDPCCNPTLQWNTCCRARSTTYLDTNAPVGADVTAIGEVCATPGAVAAAVGSFLSLSSTAASGSRCPATPPAFDRWDDYTAFLDDCQAAVFGGPSGQPACSSDADCYTTCNTDSATCVVPWDNPTPPLVACMALHMNTDLARYLLQAWDLTRITDLPDALAARVQDEDCVGPSAWNFASKWDQQPVDSCANGQHNCWCQQQGGGPQGPGDNGNNSQGGMSGPQRQLTTRDPPPTQCFQNVLVPGNQSACTAAKRCNWNPQAQDSEACGSGNFCGMCQGPQCWSLTQPAGCFYGNGNPVFPDVESPARSDCYPSNWCTDTGAPWCPSGCYVTLNNNDPESCAALNNGPPPSRAVRLPPNTMASWDANRQRCAVWGLSPSDCQAQETMQFFEGRGFRSGRYADSTECNLGYCRNNPQLSAAACASEPTCSKRCAACSGGSLCWSDDPTDPRATKQVVLAGGDTSIGVRQGVKSAGECPPEFHWTECSSLSLGACGASDGLGPALQCNVDLQAPCANQNACQQSSGDCDDWEFENWSNEACRGGGTNRPASCGAVCVIPFDDQGGQGGGNRCEFPLSWTRIGCANSSADSTSCPPGSIRKTRAHTAAECASHGTGCLERGQWGLTAKSADECTACGGKRVGLYHWTAGRWSSEGATTATTWTAKTWGSENQWKATLNQTKLRGLVQGALVSMAAQQIKGTLLCRYGLIGSVMQSVGCDCVEGGDNQGPCFTAALVPVASATMFAGSTDAVDLLYATVAPLDDTGSLANIPLAASAVDPAVLAGVQATLGNGRRRLAAGIRRPARGLGRLHNVAHPKKLATTTAVVAKRNSRHDRSLSDCASISGGGAIVGPLIHMPVTWDPEGAGVRVCLEVTWPCTQGIGVGPWTPEGSPVIEFTAFDTLDFGTLGAGGKLVIARNYTDVEYVAGSDGGYFACRNYTGQAGSATVSDAPILRQAPVATGSPTAAPTVVGWGDCSGRGVHNGTGTGCICAPGSSGVACEIVDPCYLRDCGSHGTCDPDAGACACVSPWIGPSCSVRRCGLNGVWGSGGRCICRAGWSGADCDECATPPAHGHIYLCTPGAADLVTGVIPYNLISVPAVQKVAWLYGAKTHRRTSPINSVEPGKGAHTCDCSVVIPGSEGDRRRGVNQRHNLGARVTVPDVIFFVNDTLMFDNLTFDGGLLLAQQLGALTMDAVASVSDDSALTGWQVATSILAASVVVLAVLWVVAVVQVRQYRKVVPSPSYARSASIQWNGSHHRPQPLPMSGTYSTGGYQQVGTSLYAGDLSVRTAATPAAAVRRRGAVATLNIGGRQQQQAAATAYPPLLRASPLRRQPLKK